MSLNKLDLRGLLSVARALAGAAALTLAERSALEGVPACTDAQLLSWVLAEVQAGRDPLGDAYCKLHSPAERRDRGQTFTPPIAVDSMVAWAKRQRKAVVRIVDPGAGTGRYTLAALRAFPKATAVAVELDPVVALLLRATAAAAGLADRVQVEICDYRELQLPQIEGRTLFIGNPPYVRHHDIEPRWKDWYSSALQRAGYEGSLLAGLHLHFYLRTAELAKNGDLGCYITAAEWMDAGYGSALRQLLTNGLGGTDVFVVDAELQVFGDALVSSCITCFALGSNRQELRFATIANETELGALTRGESIGVGDAKAEPKWSFFIQGGRPEQVEGHVELGELFKVARGQVTGLNRAWIERDESPPLPDRFLTPAITDAADIIRAPGAVIETLQGLRRVVTLPREVHRLPEHERAAVEHYLEWAKSIGAHETYIAQHRNPWWAVVFKPVAPAIVMTYMGRRPPAFALNRAGAQLLNIAHGLYPKRQFTQQQLLTLVQWLNENVGQEHGRSYAGGLTKFEPGEAARLHVPMPI